MEERIITIMILEALGKPADYVKDVLTNMALNIEKEKDVSLINKKVAEPKEIENGIYSSFAEIEIEVKNIQTLLMLVFKYFPSNVEIVEPQQLIVKNYDLNSFLNELATKLHKYDEISRIALAERSIMIKQIKFLQEKLKNIQAYDNKNEKKGKTKEKKSTKKKSKTGKRKKK